MKRIGICCRLLEEDGYQKYFVNRSYIEYFSQCPIQIIPLFPQNDEMMTDLIQLLDGIVIPGGDDMDSQYFHQDLHASCHIVDPIIDQNDLKWFHLAQSYHKPIFGICRGLQVINVALGGSLIQDLPASTIQHKQTLPSYKTQHTITTKDGSIIQQVLGKHYDVNSFHHQAIDQLANSLTITAQSMDGIIEAIEGENILAVQWHPELLNDKKSKELLFTWFRSL
ncbi:MAG: gamma-glutamyl-gamma-aminobutyrate hydrolase family protein [Erysipelotrichaceae bacterium]|nr:gamma-glutamyl-gamma-aminobutyrate hydrolase family protein [Erysipelotrichaceae bacterium]